MAHLRLVYDNKLTKVNNSTSSLALNEFKSQGDSGTSFTLTTTAITGNIAVIAYLPEHTSLITMAVTGRGSTTDDTTISGASLNPAFGGGKYLAVYFTATSNLTSLTVTFNTSVKVARFIVGNYWSPKYNIPYGISVGVTDLSSSDRLNSGELYTVVGPRHKTLRFDLEYLDQTDKFNLYRILKLIGKAGYVFVSAFPEDVDKEREQMYSIYGKFTELSSIVYSQYTRYTSSIDMEEF